MGSFSLARHQLDSVPGFAHSASAATGYLCSSEFCLEIRQTRIVTVDTIPPSRRSEIMARVRSKNSKAEIVVRRLVYALGYRYRLHAKSLPGQPDLVFRKRKKVIFVHGCFWHRHEGCTLSRMPKSRLEFWEPKLNGNKARDIRVNEQLALEGWKVLTIWECKLGDADALRDEIKGFLDA